MVCSRTLLTRWRWSDVYLQENWGVSVAMNVSESMHPARSRRLLFWIFSWKLTNDVFPPWKAHVCSLAERKHGLC
jgi:hypothetical protein